LYEMILAVSITRPPPTPTTKSAGPGPFGGGDLFEGVAVGDAGLDLAGLAEEGGDPLPGDRHRVLPGDEEGTGAKVQVPADRGDLSEDVVPDDDVPRELHPSGFVEDLLPEYFYTLSTH